MEFAPLPYPGGGALYELELYVTANACSVLPPACTYEPTSTGSNA